MFGMQLESMEPAPKAAEGTRGAVTGSIVVLFIATRLSPEVDFRFKFPFQSHGPAPVVLTRRKVRHMPAAGLRAPI